ncbi:MAG: GNAT family N-acetyltransferase [Rhodospirillaceae bacterium]|jgi:ribosomal-protein-alanine N-acetyltransferase|nr:GNAT family N-acetyltransferase [Rhodospirillales bacterium]MBT3904745.1 GNAT family N-acetyltransferase [Rhodospirillaceae bacterium]MBT4699466.1 GNAT family N-acetyltransferase [Rhodospirillaceae bacterium]MBT6220687.1 GNAT family N-acetyltransferase [Rhodospirillaceae bacterium]MBT7769731.1 GNAT family N-acetyltransferase [Rhodospirillales bacterium]
MGQNLIKILPCLSAHSAVVSTLHGACFDEVWNEVAVNKILSMPGVIGFLGCHENDPCGFIIGRVAADEAEIITLGVIPPWRDKGAASLLLEAFLGEALAQGAGAVYLEVADDNTAARALYTTAEFQEAGRRRNYYRRDNGREDALILRKKI